MMTDTERTIGGVERRRHASSPSGVPIHDDRSDEDGEPAEDDITKPERVLSRGISEVEVEILQRLGIAPDTVATMADIAKIISRDNRRAVENKSGSKQIGAELKELRKLLETPPNAVTVQLQDDVVAVREEVVKIQKTVRWARGIVVTAIVALLGSIGTGAAKIYNLGEQEGESTIELRHLKEGLADLRQDVRDDRARAARQFSHEQHP